MFSRLITVLSGIILIVLIVVFAAAVPAGAQQPDLKIGVFFPDPQLPGEQLPSNDDLNEFDALIGEHTDVFLWYESITESFYVDAFEPMAQAGRTIQLAWEPHNFAKDPNNQPEYRLQTITAGNHDGDIRRWARELRDFGHEVLFRPMCEMNGDWVAWGGNVNGNSPEDYIPAWRHIHDIFVQEGATNVKFVWSPNRDGSVASAQETFDTYYPGDAYVDYIGMNGYNWGRLYDTPEWTSQWQMLNEVFGYSYDVAVANTDKPVIIAETATTEVGGDAQNGGKPGWITDAFEQLPVRFPEVELITWFNVNKETDWRVNSSPASLDAFRAAVSGYIPMNPFGNLDLVSAGAPGQLNLIGWAIDPNTGSPIDVHIYVNGQYAKAVNAYGDRQDIGTAYPDYGMAHGFNDIVQVNAGSNNVCAYGINDGPGDNTLLGCKAVTVPVNPFGNLDLVSAAAPGQLNLSGWAIDPNTGSPIDSHIYVNGRYAGAFTANGSRGDIGAVFPAYGAGHGFTGSVPVFAASNTVCAYGINAGPGNNALLGCKVVNVPVNPFGNLDRVTVGAPGQLNLSGWAIDPNTGSPIDVHIYVNGRFSAVLTASGSRSDVGAAFPAYGAAHGYSGTIPGATGNTVCAYGINNGAGANTLIGCRVV